MVETVDGYARRETKISAAAGDKDVPVTNATVRARVEG